MVSKLESSLELESSDSEGIIPRSDKVVPDKPVAVPLLARLGLGLGLGSIPISVPQSVLPPLVSHVKQLKQYLIQMYASLYGNNNTFLVHKSVIDLEKLLQLFHDFKETFVISSTDKTTYYSCIGYICTSPSSVCTYVSLHQIKYEMILCNECQNQKSSNLRKRKCGTAKPTRTRSFNNLSPDEKIIAYKDRNNKFKSVSMKYTRLVSKLKSREECFTVPHSTPAIEILRNFTLTYLINGIIPKKK